MTRNLNFLTAVVLATAALFATATGCELIASVDRSKIGQGGGGGNGGSGGTGGAPCDPTQCPDPGTTCLVAVCTNGACATENAPASTACTDNGGKVCDGNGACVACVDAATDCPATGNECVVATCTAGACGTMNVDVDTPTTGGQTAGDCKIQVCDGNGSTKQNDDDDPTDDMNDCTMDTCNAGVNVHTNIAGACNDNGGVVCGALGGPKEGTCVECNGDGDCTAPNVCDPQGTNTCVPFLCTDLVKNGNETGTDCGGPDCGDCPNGQGCMGANDCQSGFCNGTTCAACTLDANCAANEFCGTATIGTQGVCSADLGNGSACSAASQCTSGNCVDGFCCDTACGGTCQACSAAKKGAGLDGACGSIVIGTDPDSECAGNGGNDVCDGNGACKEINGTACAAGSECVSGQCVDGVCCNNACTGNCQACSNAKTGGANGTCGNVTANTDPDADCTGAQVCSAGACVGGPNGAACALGTECASGNCVDGLCCNTACTGTCQACNVAGSLGTCTNVPSGQQDTVTCVGTNQCDGAGACKQQNGTACASAGACFSGNCVDGFCCNTACGATCQACSNAKTGGTNGVCGNVTNGSDPDADCPGMTNCNGAGACALFANGTACTLAGECTSGNCVDGFCCNAACSGLCQACSNALTGGVNGTCGNITAGTDPGNECNGNSGTDVCDGAGACKKANGTSCSLGTECSSGNCIDGFCCNTTCAGACLACSNVKTGGANGTCGNITAGTDPDNECNDALVCNGSGACMTGPLGTACTSGVNCASGFCPAQDGVCCDTACSGTCQACTALKTGGMDGTCGNVADNTDPDTECPGPQICLAGACM